jgi:4-amino-4-deoxy-L-arabinose transferase-like glycosyltransferase
MTRRPLAALALGCLVLFGAGAARIGVVDRDEARFALAVREMTERSDWIVPSNWGQPRYAKPILIYWLGRGSQAALGPSELALRLPSILCATGAVLLTFAAVRRRYGERTGWRAAAILATTLMLVVEAHAFTADATMLLGVTLSFWAWARLRESPEPAFPWQLLFWLGVAWGALAKGVNVAFLAAAGAALVFLERSWSERARRVLAGAVVVAMLAVSIPGLGVAGPLAMAGLLGFFLVARVGDRAYPRAGAGLGWIFGVPLALALVAAWGVPALLATDGQFWTQGVEGDLVARSARPFEGHGGIPGYFLLTGLVAFFPWAALVPDALGRLRVSLARDAHLRFLLAWVVGPWILLELSTSKLPHYTLVVFPALAVFVALETERRASGERARWPRLEAALASVPCVALAVAAGVMAEEFRRTQITLAAVGFAVLALAVGVSWWRSLARGAGDPFPTLALGSALLYLGAFGVLFPSLEPVRVAQPVARAVERHLRPSDRLLLHGLRHESVGYAAPRVPELERNRERVAEALGDPDVLLVVTQRYLERVVRDHPDVRYEHVDTVRGYVLWHLDEETVWLVRGQAG